MIPKIIHQVWWQGEDDIPEDLIAAHNSWKKHHPDWVHILWTTEMMNSLILHEYPWFWECYNNYQYDIQRCDAIRYFFLHHYGGVYADMDLLCQRSLDPVIDNLEYDLAFCKSSHVNSFSNWLIFSSRGHEFWPQMWAAMLEASNTRRVLDFIKHIKVMNTTGPTILNSVIDKTGVKCDALVDGFNNCGVCDPRPCDCPECYVINLNLGKWNGWDSMMMNFFLCNWKIILMVIFIGVVILVLRK